MGDELPSFQVRFIIVSPAKKPYEAGETPAIQFNLLGLDSPPLAAQSFALFSNRYPAACGGVVHFNKSNDPDPFLLYTFGL
jgi:hypothetical protein